MTSIAPSVPTSLVPVEEIRSCFPALERRQAGHSVAYFDGPGGTQVPKAVADAMTEYLYHHNANTHWAYPSSSETDAALAQGRATLAQFMNATPGGIVFGANMTTLTFHLARALGRKYGVGDEIVVTELDHHGNVDPWRALERERGIKVRAVKMNPETGQLDWQDLEKQVSRKTRLVACGVASNALGTVNDAGRIGRLAHAAGALFFADAVHSAPHLLTDVRAWDCDFLVCSAYKFYGPHIGVLYAREDLLESIDFPKLRPAPDTVPERAETGTQNHEGVVGAAAAVDFIAALAGGSSRRERLRCAFEGLDERGRALTKGLWEGLAEIPGVTLYSPPPSMPRTPTVAFTVRGVASTEVARRLALSGLFLSHGNFYAASVVERLELGAEGLVRAGCACYTTHAEVERLIDGVRAIESA